jgi:hypothetical protein
MLKLNVTKYTLLCEDKFYQVYHSWHNLVEVSGEKLMPCRLPSYKQTELECRHVSELSSIPNIHHYNNRGFV